MQCFFESTLMFDTDENDTRDKEEIGHVTSFTLCEKLSYGC